MTISVVDLIPLHMNQNANVQVGRLPDDIVAAMGWRLPYVYLNGERLAHILLPRHGVAENDVCLIPFALSDGLILQEAGPRRLTICYQPPRDDRRFKLACKLLDRGYDMGFDVSSNTATPNQGADRPKQSPAKPPDSLSGHPLGKGWPPIGERWGLPDPTKCDRLPESRGAVLRPAECHRVAFADKTQSA